MLWTLLIWAVVGLVVPFVWTGVVLVRATKNGYDFDLYMNVMDSVMDEHYDDVIAKYGKFMSLVLIILFNHIFWPAKYIWLTKDLLPKIDDLYVDLTLEKLEKGEQA